MRVDLRRRNIGVSEHCLNRARIRAVLKEVRRKTVPQSVWRNVFESAFFGVFRNEFMDNLARLGGEE